MYFRIASVIHDQKQIQLSDDNYQGGDTAYTIITGRNASGKSRLLRKIVSNYIFSDHYDLLEASDVLPAFYSETRPSCVIAVSTGSRDKFPRPNNKITESGIEYHYIGATGSKNDQGGMSTLSSSFLQVIRNLADDDRHSVELAKAFEMLGYRSSFNLTIAEGYELKREREKRRTQRTAPDFRFELSMRDVDKIYTALKLKPGAPLTLALDILSGAPPSIRHVLPLVIELVEKGLLRVVDTELVSLHTKNRHKFSDASSGQQCMIQMLIGLAASMRNQALICIDEPEISLHPEWQARVISLLQEIFKSYKGCHFFIATHSPQVVSGLQAEAACVINLENHQIFYPEFYSERSADFQLSRVFEEPGYRNEFLLRTALKLLSKLASNKNLDDAEKQAARHLTAIKARLKENDPVLHLIEQIQVLNEK
ncbi:AAA family ATPase [Pseudomonas putida]|uniref:AAA family ATPase n=1 Tax=Pseudomonas putida TaxID=303 RepID=UPI003F8CD360